MNRQYLQNQKTSLQDYGYQTQLSMVVNVIFVEDRTGSMRQFHNQVKNRVKDMYTSIRKKCEEKGRIITELNVGVVSFGDLNFEKNWIDVSPLFRLNEGEEQVQAFKRYVDGIRCRGGGGDGPESALEAISAAIHSYDLSAEADRTRTIFVVLTDAPAHPLQSPGRKCNWYPKDAEEDLDGLYAAFLDMQGKVSSRSKRLVIFAPDVYPWRQISQRWVQTNFCESIAGLGLQDVDMDSVYSFIADSI